VYEGKPCPKTKQKLLFIPIISYDGTFLSLRYAQGQA
jgi:hypothetical protein